MKKYIFVSIFILLLSFTYGQSIKVRSFDYANKLIYVDYTVTGLSYYQTLTPQLFVSIDKGETYIGPLKFVSGDINEIKKSSDYRINWDYIKEVPFTEADLIFEVRATLNEKDRSSKMYVSVVGNSVTPLGIRAGLLGKTGVYLEARTSMSPAQSTTYNYNGQVYDYDKSGYYQLSGADQNKAMTVLLGLNAQLSWNTFLYLAAGYGTDSYGFEIDNFDYDSNAKIGSDWVKDETNLYSGVEIDLGMMFRLGDIILSAGGTILNFEQPGFTIGLGYNFSIK